MVIGTALGFSEWGTVGLAVGLAFLFGYGLTSLPLLRAGFALSAVIPIALAADTFSITVMEVVDNAVMLLIPGAMEEGATSLLFWASLSFALSVPSSWRCRSTAGSSPAARGMSACTRRGSTADPRREWSGHC